MIFYFKFLSYSVHFICSPFPMSCCSSTGTCTPKCCPSTCFLRLAFGLVLVGYGVNHYRNLAAFVGYAKSPFLIPAVATVAGLLAYVVPALMIVGGVLFAIKQQKCIAKCCIITSLAGILGWAGLAILLNPDMAAMKSMGEAINNAGLLLVVFFVVKKLTCCASSCAPAECSTKGGSCCK